MVSNYRHQVIAHYVASRDDDGNPLVFFGKAFRGNPYRPVPFQWDVYGYRTRNGRYNVYELEDGHICKLVDVRIDEIDFDTGGQQGDSALV